MIGERNIDSGKLPFRKEEEQQFPCEIPLSVFLPSLTKMLAMTQELSIDLPLSNRVANQMEISDEKIRRKNNSQSAFCTQSAVCSMHFVLTGS